MKGTIKNWSNNHPGKGVTAVVLVLALLSRGIPEVEAQTPAAPLTVEAAIDYAMKNNRDLKASAFDEQFARERVKEVRSQGLPQVNLTGRLQDNIIIPTSLLPAEIVGGAAGTFIPVRFGTQYNATGGIEASQLLYSQSYLVGLKAAKTSEEFYQLNSRKVKEDVAYNVSASYYNAQISARQLEILQGNLERLRQLAAISQVQYQNGILKKSDADRIRVNITNLETQIANLQTGYIQQLNLLKFLIGMPVTAEISIVSKIDENENVAVNFNRDENIFARRTDFQILNKQRELYELERKNVNSGYAPSLSAFGNFNYQAFRQEFNFLRTDQPWFRTSVIGLNLNIPVFDGLRKRAQAQQSNIRMKQVENQTEKLQESITLDVVNSNAKLANARTALVAQSENRGLAEQVYNQTQLQYKEGVASLSDLLNSETELRNAQNNYINALVQLKLAALELRKADGSLLADTASD
jgi:outer membrane protein TolC